MTASDSPDIAGILIDITGATRQDHPMGTCGNDPLVRAWLRDHQRRNLSPGTIEKRESAARRLAEHAGKRLLDVTREDIEQWLDSRTKLSAKSRYTEISHIAAFFKWAIREEHTEVDPTARITRPKLRQGLPRPIATEDLRHAIEGNDILDSPRFPGGFTENSLVNL